ncbi:MAG: LysM peptidoglycan-binding domain-containing protein [Planctomycetes bacterium]|nr:LysM peptidoglycan-binding domain-containing protein [Planctomycetota bacterium]
MDRGVKIAIFVASIVSLGLGLVWDQVLSQARVVVEKPAENPMGPELINANVGAPTIPRLELARKVDAAVEAVPPELGGPAAPAPGPDKPPAPAAEAVTEYEVQAGDSWWKIANRVFQDRGLSSKDFEDANPGVKLVAGKKIKVPPARKAK